MLRNMIDYLKLPVLKEGIHKDDHMSSKKFVLYAWWVKPNWYLCFDIFTVSLNTILINENISTMFSFKNVNSTSKKAETVLKEAIDREYI